jgi:hypothetical protein
MIFVIRNFFNCWDCFYILSLRFVLSNIWKNQAQGLILNVNENVHLLFYHFYFLVVAVAVIVGNIKIYS